MLSRVVLGFPKPLEHLDSSLPSLNLTGLNGMSPIWYLVPDRYPLRHCLNLSSLVRSARCCLNFAGQLDSLFFASLSLLFHCLLLLFFVCPWLKANLSLTVRFLFRLFGSPASVHLEFPASASSPLCNVSQEGGHLFSHELSTSSSSMVRYFGYFVK